MQSLPVVPFDVVCERHCLDDGSLFFTGRLPEDLRSGVPGFEELWQLHPAVYARIKILGKEVSLPRWQAAYDVSYDFSRQTCSALPRPQMLTAILEWCRAAIDPRLNGFLVNWYDGRLGHYIGPHKDSIAHMVVGAPIVTVSFGEERIFRLSHPKLQVRRDFLAQDGSVFLLPFQTNRSWKHSVPHFARYQGRRISITLRAFQL